MGENRLNLKDLYIEEIEKILYDINQEKYRAKQIFKWLYKGICTIDEMTDISKGLKDSIKEKFYISCLNTINLQKTEDGTSKYLFKLQDGNTVESVLMKYKYGNTACISTQIGCKMGCKFCASSHVGFMRNLSAGEIIDQILSIQKESGERVSKLVFMGIGEPLENYDNTIRALKLINHPLGLNIGFRNISISTCGLVPSINKLAQEKLPITLSISLHAPNDKIRNEIMPISKRYSIDELINTCKNYIQTTNRKIYFEYVLINDVNDSEENAIELSKRIKGLLANVNLIQLNEVPTNIFKRSSKEATNKFINVLKKRGIEVTLRRELGNEIDAACGQLRVKNL